MRARNLKPGFFANEQLGGCTPHARLLFAGLWCMADREGRLLDRPARIGGELFPYDDNLDIDALLDELFHHDGLITRYSADDRKLIQINNFSKHQRPHQNEVQSQLPPPPEGPSNQGSKPLATKVESDFALNPSSLIPSSLNPDPSPRKRKLDPIWDAIVAKFFKTLCKSDRTRIGKLVRDLKQKGVTDGAEINTRADRLTQDWGDDKLTPESLLKHWDRFGDQWKPADGKRRTEADRGEFEEDPGQVARTIRP